MKKEHDFSQGKRGPVIRPKGKTRITIYLDNDTLDSFRERADQAGTGYQTMINQALREYLERSSPQLDEATLRRVLREELRATGYAAEPISRDEALHIAQTDALRVYRNLSEYEVHVCLKDDGWHVDYELASAELQGGGPHYVIDTFSGRLLSKRYEQ